MSDPPKLAGVGRPPCLRAQFCGYAALAGNDLCAFCATSLDSFKRAWGQRADRRRQAGLRDLDDGSPMPRGPSCFKGHLAELADGWHPFENPSTETP